MKLIIVILSVFFVLGRLKLKQCSTIQILWYRTRNWKKQVDDLNIQSHFIATGANTEESESISSEEAVELEKMIEPRGFLDDISKCGMCETAMNYINKKVSKDSSKVSQCDKFYTSYWWLLFECFVFFRRKSRRLWIKHVL